PMRRKWIVGSWILLIAASGSALFGHSRTAAAMQAAVSATRVDDVPRIKLCDTTPDVVAGRETELDPTEPTLDLYIPPSDRATGAGVLILPGGGYQMLTVPGEGADPARFFLSRNVAAFVLRYRHGPRYHYPTTLLDAQRALRLIRARAQEYRVDPAKLGVLGGSAGGHLAAMLATLYDNMLLPEPPYVPDATDGVSARPSFVLLLYPVIDLSDDAVTHRGSRTNLTQDTPILYDALSPQKHVTRDTPPGVHGPRHKRPFGAGEEFAALLRGVSQGWSAC
ncbi:MAG TPA: alpha/beta hydrolase, partial [Gemmatimonadales bacterium]|nr:alpha/beta hydrolase [Gemmatimonadales bacterium]